MPDQTSPLDDLKAIRNRLVNDRRSVAKSMTKPTGDREAAERHRTAMLQITELIAAIDKAIADEKSFEL